MTLDQIREKFKAGSLLRRIVGSKTFSAVQEVTEDIYHTLESHSNKINKLEKRIEELERFKRVNE